MLSLTGGQNPNKTYQSVLHSHTVLPFVEYIGNQTRFYSLKSYTELVKNNFNDLKLLLLLAGNLKVGKPGLCCFFFKTQHRFLN